MGMTVNSGTSTSYTCTAVDGSASVNVSGSWTGSESGTQAGETFTVSGTATVTPGFSVGSFTSGTVYYGVSCSGSGQNVDSIAIVGGGITGSVERTVNISGGDGTTGTVTHSFSVEAHATTGYAPDCRTFSGPSISSSWTKSVTHLQTVTYTYAVAYDANGGTGAPSTQSASSTTSSTHDFTVSSTIPTWEDYEFRGWSTSPTGGAQYVGGDTITVAYNDGDDGTVTLYAVWGSAYTVYVKTSDGWQEASTVYVKTSDGWQEAASVYIRGSEGWQESG